MKTRSFFNKDGTKSVLSTLISILIGLIAGALIILIVGLVDDKLGLKEAWKGIRLIFFGLFSKGQQAGRLVFGFNSTNIGDMLFRAVPIIMTGLSVSLAYKTGLFNIGASGQYLAGTTAALFIALKMNTAVVAPWIVWILAFFGGMLAGAFWGAIPGMLKAFLNINEVLACIMTNWLAANIVTWVFEGSGLQCTEGTKTQVIWKTSHNGVATAKMGLDKLFPESQQVDGGIIIVILIAILVYILLTKTTLGFELKACGANRHSARYAGIKDKRSIVLSMAIAGALAGAGAALYYLSGSTEFHWQTYLSLPGEGFTGIAVALLGACNPIANIFTGMFLSTLDVAGSKLSFFTEYNEYITDVIIAVIVYLSAFSLLIKTWLTKKFKKTEDKRIPDVVYTSKNSPGDNAPPVSKKTAKEGAVK
ncbi:MAG: ABC transporter permease [Clostridia bacterium]|nr:ABC transporter permease [Clostridia bacterium]MBQ2517551.1 ABC transporter permease [Clostridia bacterium]MBQ4341805.1 ABC transporter permease [Clostridia bacterium]